MLKQLFHLGLYLDQEIWQQLSTRSAVIKGERYLSHM